MAYTTVNKSTDYFNTVLWTGNGGANSINMGLQPDWTWIKNRNLSGGSAQYHHVYDSVRGGNLRLVPNENSAENTTNDRFNGITSTGFNLVGNDNGTNGTGATYVAWGWKANGQGSSNYDGSINTTYTSVNTTAGFSISTYTGTGANATVGHGLGVAPQMIIVKNRTNAQNWFVYHQGMGATKVTYLDLSNAEQTLASGWNNTAPTSSVFSVGTEAGTNQSSANMIAYCFAEKIGYSKFGKYIGNANANGTFVYTGFKPAWVLLKQINTTNNWLLFDNKRPGYNLTANFLEPDAYGAEAVNNPNNRIDILSNGFKIRGSGTATNASGGTYIYMTFGQSIVGTNNIPATAR